MMFLKAQKTLRKLITAVKTSSNACEKKNHSTRKAQH